ncbi:hypothetical protein EDD22DRAFT_959469 [Suillus occidentalis]|nr:hypothetical protein EDD22DRAFT_959469 [Suillus occidentalis]
MSHAEGSTSDSVIQTEGWEDNSGGGQPVSSCPPGSEAQTSQSSFGEARQKRKIAELEGKIFALESGRVLKESIEDLINENDRRYDDGYDDDTQATINEDQLQTGYSFLTKTLPWFLKHASDMDHDDYMCMLKVLRQGADGTQGDDTAKLKTLVSDWVNHELKPDPPVDSDDKNCRGFVVKAGIRDRSDGHIVMDLSFPAFVYEKYTPNADNLEEGLFKGKILLQGYKAIFTSPSSAKDVKGDSDGVDVIANNWCTKKSFCGMKVKKHVMQIIKMDKVTPRSIAYAACQVRFALSSVTSWRSIDGDFDYILFWRCIMDFFECPPGQEVRHRIEKLLEWWTRKVFGRSRCEDLSNTAKAGMSVNALARQRKQLDDAAFDSD